MNSFLLLNHNQFIQMAIKIKRTSPDSVFEERIVMPYGKDVPIVIRGYQDVVLSAGPFDFGGHTFLFELYNSEHDLESGTILTYSDGEFERSQSDDSDVDDVIRVVLFHADFVAIDIVSYKEYWWRINALDAAGIEYLLARGPFVRDHK